MAHESLADNCDHCVALAVLRNYCEQEAAAVDFANPTPPNIAWTCDHCHALQILTSSLDPEGIHSESQRLRDYNQMLYAELARKGKLIAQLRRTVGLLTKSYPQTYPAMRLISF